jgi:hypothetical protein
LIYTIALRNIQRQVTEPRIKEKNIIGLNEGSDAVNEECQNNQDLKLRTHGREKKQITRNERRAEREESPCIPSTATNVAGGTSTRDG